MADGLKHRSDYHIDQWVDRKGSLAVARIGYPYANRCLWPLGLNQNNRSCQAFVFGALLSIGVGDISISETKNPVGVSKLLNAVRGYYSMLFVDWGSGTIILSVDRRASHPLYYLMWNGCIFFAPEVKALICLKNFHRKIDFGGMASIIANGFLLNDQTLFGGIRRLPAGNALVVRDGQFRRLRYFEYVPASRVTDYSEQDLIERLESLITQSIAQNIDDPARTAVLLSGGVDSRGILAAALRSLDPTQINVVTWGPSLSAEPDSDVEIAKKIAAEYSLKHLLIRRDKDNFPGDFEFTNYLMDGMSKAAVESAPQRSVLEELHDRGFDTVIRGDEIFGWNGRLYELRGAFYESGIRRLSQLSTVRRFLEPSAYQRMCECNDATMDELFKTYGQLSVNNAKDMIYFEQRYERLISSSSKSRQIFFDDRNVLLSEDILDFMQHVPERLRINKLLFRKVVRLMNPRLSEVAFSVNRSPENWRDELSTDTVIRRYFAAQFADHHSGIWEYFDQAALKALVESFSAPGKMGTGSLLSRVRPAFQQKASALAPRLTQRVRDDVRERLLPREHLLMRVLMLKHWHDRFIA